MIRDIALVQDADGKITVHRARCPEARDAAAAGRPVMTMFQIQRPIPRDQYRHHECMEERHERRHDSRKRYDTA